MVEKTKVEHSSFVSYQLPRRPDTSLMIEEHRNESEGVSVDGAIYLEFLFPCRCCYFM